MDIDMVGRIDDVVNDNLRSPSQLPFKGTTLQSTSSKKVEEKKIKLDLLGVPLGFK
ncbi:putative RING/FYVE/PHD zinc finger protein, partial [Trifolium medium]|nr:putative RING/FYVE/PHD zinc finger protein [Trifolium medium]